MNIDPTLLLLATGLALIGGLFGFLVGWIIQAKKLSRAESEIIRLTSVEQTQEQTNARLQLTLNELAAAALEKNNQRFLQLAEENFRKFQFQASADLKEREKAVEQLVKPIAEALKKTEQQIGDIEKDRQRSFGSITEQLKLLAETQQRLYGETSNLVKALRRPEVRGQWGELTLRRLAELAGMVDHCDFYEQENITTDEGRMRPDMVIRLPDDRELVVDVKTPLDSYLNAMEASDDESRNIALTQHARKVRERINELAKKEYWEKLPKSPDFVILFIPGDQFLSAALDRDANLIEDALRQKVMLATPTSFVALLKAVAFGWRQVALAENAEKIRELGEDLYNRLSTYSEHMQKVGKSLGSAVENYNKAVGSLERNVLPGARKFNELGIHAKKDIPELDPLEVQARRIEIRGDNDDE